jgi:hypothetical protein
MNQIQQQVTNERDGFPTPVQLYFFLGGFITGVGCMVGAALLFIGSNPLLITAIFLTILLLLAGVM